MKIFLLALLLITAPFSAPHDFHTALAEMQHNAKKQVMEVSLRAFTDDIELAIAKAGLPEPNFKIGRDEVPPSLATYLENNFILLPPKGDGLPLKMVGHELDQDVTWVYFEVNLGELRPEDIKVDFLLLTEVFDDQSNILNYKGIDDRRTILFRTGATRLSLLEK